MYCPNIDCDSSASRKCAVSGVAACPCPDPIPGCEVRSMVLVDQIFDSARIDRTLRDIELCPENARPICDCGKDVTPVPPYTFNCLLSTCSNAILSDLVLIPTQKHDSGCVGGAGCGCGGGCSGGCGCGGGCGCAGGSVAGARCIVEPSTVRVRARVDLPVQIFFTDARCRCYVADAVISATIDVVMDLPCNAQIASNIEVLATAVSACGCTLDDKFIVTVNMSILVFITARVPLNVDGTLVKDLRKAVEYSEDGKSCVNALEDLPLFPQVRCGGKLLHAADTHDHKCKCKC
ncbi:MAG: hypothetical protein ACOX88_02330 [Christensenellales bacterium]|jgi:hypothetical protein